MARQDQYDDDYDDDVDEYDDRPRKRRRRGGRLSEAQLEEAKSKKLTAGLCGILLGYLGIHKFILGYKAAGIIMLLITVLSCLVLALIPSVIGLIEGIIYMTKSDEEFYETYIAGQKEWF